MLRLFMRLCNLARHKGKALGLREQHIYQRHEDGSYTLTIRMIPTAGRSDVGSVDGAVVYQSRGIIGHET